MKSAVYITKVGYFFLFASAESDGSAFDCVSVYCRSCQSLFAEISLDDFYLPFFLRLLSSVVQTDGDVDGVYLYRKSKSAGVDCDNVNYLCFAFVGALLPGGGVALFRVQSFTSCLGLFSQETLYEV